MKVIHAGLNKRLKELEVKESRLLDLAADGTLSRADIRTKVAELRADRQDIEARLSVTTAELSIGVDVLLGALDLIADPMKLYRDGTDEIRRTLNQTFFKCFRLDQHGIREDSLNPPFDDFHQAAETRTAKDKVAQLAGIATT
jgi:site-specific DNA recombinase